MPAATTHTIFAQEVYVRLSDGLKKSITNMNMFLLGSQGPDLLLFSGGSILPGNLNSYGSLMHDEKQDLFLPFFDRYSDNDTDLKSYFLGFLCHYALDREAHPLICAAARKTAEETGENEGVLHVSMEGEIDVWMLNQRGRDTSTYDVYKYLRVSAQCRRKLGCMYHEMFKEVFDLDLSLKKLIQTGADTAFFTRLLSPSQLKYKVFYQFENLMKMKHKFSGMMLINKSYSGVLNLEKKALPLKHDPSSTISSSFPEVYGRAMLAAAELLADHSEKDYTLNFAGAPTH